MVVWLNINGYFNLLKLNIYYDNFSVFYTAHAPAEGLGDRGVEHETMEQQMLRIRTKFMNKDGEKQK